MSEDHYVLALVHLWHPTVQYYAENSAHPVPAVLPTHISAVTKHSPGSAPWYGSIIVGGFRVRDESSVVIGFRSRRVSRPVLTEETGY